jgi:hypothetical protein
MLGLAMAIDARTKRVAVVALLLMLGLALAWHWSRDPTPAPVPGPADARVRADGPARARGLHRPPPRRLGSIEAPSASVHEDDHADAGALAGVVQSWLDASPVADAELTFIGRGSIHSVVTGADGRFLFVAPQPGSYTLASVLADGWSPYAPELGQAPLRYMARPDRRVEGAVIELWPAAEIIGRVEDEVGAAVAGAEIRWLGIGTGETALAADDDGYTSDARGEFRLTARHDAWLEARHDVHGVGRARVDERAVALGSLVLRLAVADAAATEEIAGRVLDPAGEPVEGARVLGEPEGDEPSAETVTDDDGRFVLQDLVPGPHRVEARYPGFAPVWASGVPTGADALVLQLAPGGAIAGTITAEGGSAVPGSTVVALRHTGRLTRVPQAQATVFDADGEYRLDGLPPAVYDVVGGAAGHALVRARDVEVGAAEVELSLVLPAGGRISGRVVDETTGEAVELARVEVDRSLAAGPSVAPLRSSALTDDTGAFEIRGVEAGRCSIHAYALGYGPRAISGLQVEAGADAGPVEVSLRPAEDADAGGQAFDIVGIGVKVRVDGEALRVDGVIEGGGGERAGLLVGDLLLAVDGVPIAELLDFGEAVQALRGREGTEAVLLVERGEAEPFEATAVRSRIRG